MIFFRTRFIAGWDDAPAATAALAESFALSAVYPNPSSSGARLTLELAAAQRVEASVFDALGRRVMVLHEGNLEAGTHAFVLDPDRSGLPTGVYVIRVTGEAFSATRRAMLIE